MLVLFNLRCLWLGCMLSCNLILEILLHLWVCAMVEFLLVPGSQLCSHRSNVLWWHLHHDRALLCKLKHNNAHWLRGNLDSPQRPSNTFNYLGEPPWFSGKQCPCLWSWYVWYINSIIMRLRLRNSHCWTLVCPHFGLYSTTQVELWLVIVSCTWALVPLSPSPQSSAPWPWYKSVNYAGTFQWVIWFAL